MTRHMSPMPARPRIAHLIESDGPGGAERLVVELAIEFRNRGMPGVVFVPEHGEGWIARALDHTGIQLATIDLAQRGSVACVRSLATAFRRLNITIAHSHEFTMAVYGAAASRLAGIPHVITMHGGRYFTGRVHRRVAMRYAVMSSGGAIAVSHQLAATLCRELLLPQRWVDVIPNGVRTPVGSPGALRAECGLAPADRLVVAIGNLYPVKGHRFLIDALARLPRSLSVHIAIAGRGSEEAALVSHARALGIEERVHLLGLRSDIAAILSSADAFVHPSLAEGTPVAVLEAMTLGLPIIASSVGEIPQLLANGAGLLVAPTDTAAIAAALSNVLTHSDRAREMGARAALRAASEYSLKRMADAYADRYRSLLTAHHAPLIRTAAQSRPVFRRSSVSGSEG